MFALAYRLNAIYALFWHVAGELSHPKGRVDGSDHLDRQLSLRVDKGNAPGRRYLASIFFGMNAGD